MKSFEFIGLEFNEVSLKKLFFAPPMLIAYVFIAIAIFGTYEIFHVRYFSEVANAHSSGLDPTNPELIRAMKLAVFGEVGEVSREVPWTLFIANYMYMIYTGSGVIFIVALCEVFGVHLIERVAAGFLVVGLSMVFAGLFTILVDMNFLNLPWMFLTPNMTTGMWLMLPLYCVYVPYVLLEIYLLLTKKRDFVKKFAYGLVILSIAIDIIEYFIQARLFSMNTARHLWTEFPVLTFYYIVTAFASGLGIMIVNTYLVHQDKPRYEEMMELFRKWMLVCVSVLGLYEIIGYMVVDKAWAFIILFGEFKYLYFLGYILLTIALPFLFVVVPRKSIFTLWAGVFTIIGGYIGRYIFVYGGNANPMTNRFGVGYEKYDMYAIASKFNYIHPHLGEICIAVGSVGICIVVYQLFDAFFSLDKVREHQH